MDTETANSVVLEALTQACSQDASILKPAEQQLQIWETQPGFYTTLVVGFFCFFIFQTIILWYSL